MVGCAGDHGCARHGEQGSGHEALKGPVIRAMRLVGGWERRRVVYCALEDGCGSSDLIQPSHPIFCPQPHAGPKRNTTHVLLAHT